MKDKQQKASWEISLPKFLFNPVVWIVLLIVIGFAGYTIANRPDPQASIEGDTTLQALCIKDKGKDAWMKMKPMRSGKVISDQACWGCMIDNNNMICDKSEYEILNSAMKPLSKMKLTAFDVALAKERMDKNNDGICDTCGMPMQQCIDSGQMDCNMGNNPQAIGILGSQHIHADFKVYINGQPVDFSDKDHMGRMRDNLPVSSFIHVDSGSPAPEKTGDILHMHAKNVPLWLFFRSIGMNLTKDSLTLADGKVYKSENGNTLKFYLNGQVVDELGEYSFQPLDKLLISYGPDNDRDIQKQINSVTNFAKDH